MSDHPIQFRKIIENSWLSKLLFKWAAFKKYRVANIITSFRAVGVIYLMVLFIFFMDLPKAYYISRNVYFVVWLLDLIDGWIARINKSTTKFGKWFDRFVDKLADFVMLKIIFAYSSLAAWSVIITESSLILSIALELYLDVDPSSGKYGKAKTVT